MSWGVFKLKGFFKAITIAEARSIISDLRGLIDQALYKEKAQDVHLLDALGRTVASDIKNPNDLPGFDRSTVDGYAVRASDTFGASEEAPVRLRLTGKVGTGLWVEESLPEKSAMAVSTGAMLPGGADGAVMVEYTEEEADGQWVLIHRPVTPGENRLRRGEDVPAGHVVIKAGDRLNGPRIGLLSGMGVTRVEVLPRIRVGLISSGDEVVPPDEPCPGAKVRDINAYAMAALIKESGGEPHLYGVVPDDFEQLKNVVSQALKQCHVVCLSGGSSVGTRDLTEQVLSSFPKAKKLFHGLHVKPGKPTMAMVVDGVPVFGLPGQPASALVTFHLAVRPLLGYDNSAFHKLEAKIERRITSQSGREEYIPVRLEEREDGWWAIPVFGKSGLISPLSLSQGLACIAEEKLGVEPGEILTVYRLSEPI